MRNKKLLFYFLFLTVCLLIFGGEAVWAQKDDDTKSRSITSDDFNSQRPAGNNSKRTNKISNKQKNLPKPKIRRAQYKYIKQEKSVVRRNPNRKRKNTSLSQPTKTAEVGVTMWRMRQPLRADLGPKLPVQMTDGSRQMWIPERVDTQTIFYKGDRVRIAIESSVVGYLYVIDSEIYSDGRFGPPALIFPDANQDNSVQPGLLVDIPDQKEDLPYFLIDPKGTNYAGELLTVIISPNPLLNLKVDKERYIKNLDELSDLEENSDVELFSRTDRLDKTYTKEEANAACGATARTQLIREKSTEKPCGDQARQLTREEPLPQSIYRVKTVAGQAFVAFIRLGVGK